MNTVAARNKQTGKTGVWHSVLFANPNRSVLVLLSENKKRQSLETSLLLGEQSSGTATDLESLLLRRPSKLDGYDREVSSYSATI